MKISKKRSRKNRSNHAADLQENGNWQRIRFELKPKNKTVTIRMSEDLLEVIKEKAKERGLDYQKFIRMALEHFVGRA